MRSISAAAPENTGARQAISVTTPAAYHGQTIELYVLVDDDGKGQGMANECIETNNKINLGKVYCKVIG